MFTDEQEAQGFEEYQAMQERELVNVAIDAEKEGKRRAHWAIVAAACLILAASGRSDAKYWAKDARKYAGFSRPDHLAEARAELVARARRRMA